MMHAVVSTANTMQAQGASPPNLAENAAALALSLAALRESKEILICLSAAVGSGLFDRTYPSLKRHASRKLIMDLFANALGTRTEAAASEGTTPLAELQAGEFQQLTSPETIWTDPGNLVPALLLARRRLCVVQTFKENGDRDKIGTGFLVGPSAVLTNHHVVDGLPKHLEFPEDRLELRFDYSPTTGLEDAETSIYFPEADWCLADSPPGPLSPDDIHDNWWSDRTRREAWRELVKSSLDYAVVLLSSSPGHLRGWYDLNDVGNPRYNRGCWVLHHPSGQSHTVTEGEVHFARRGVTRMFHSASTVKGSSGGLVLDSTGMPVGLHHLGLSHLPATVDGEDLGGYRVPDEVVNCAVVLDSIASDLKTKGVFGQLALSRFPAPFRGCLDGVRPVFGRKTLMQNLAALYQGDKPVMRLHVADSAKGVQKPGKTFTIDVVRALFRPPENHHIVLNAEDIQHDALHQTEAVLRGFAPDLVDSLPRMPDTTTPAFVARLVNHLGSAIQDRLSNKTVWMMIDSLDRHTLSDASGREFLATLYAQVHTIKNLRIILIGLPVDIAIGGLDPNDVISSSISIEDIDNTSVLFETWLDERGAREKAMGADARKLLSRTIAAYAGTDKPLERMADFTETYMPDVLKAVFGTAALETDGET